MRYLSLILLVSLAVPCQSIRAQDPDELRVLDSPERALLHEQLLAEVGRQYSARRQDVAAALASAEAVQARRETLRLAYREMLGDFPDRTPLDARTTGTIVCDDYRIEKVIYESRPGHHITANLYLPAAASKANRVPGVLVPCGHSDNGKANGPYQSVCILLARNGCAALVYDPIGQGERNQLPGLSRHGTTEHTLVGIGALLVGWNTANYRVWDGLRSMDYLASREEIDASKLGCTGNSGGGTMTTWLMALDERIQAAAPGCFITTVERLFATIGPQDCEQHFPGQGARGLEHTDFVTMRAPKPTLILAAEQDFFDFAGTRTAYAEAAAIYRALGKPDQVALFSYDDKHGFSQPRREAAVHWMRRHLAGDDGPIHELAPTLQPDDKLQVTHSGQVLRDFAAEVTVVDLAKRRAVELAESRTQKWKRMGATEQIATVKRILNLTAAPPAETTTRPRGTIDRGSYTIEKIIVERPACAPLPALLCVPKSDASKPAKLPAIIFADGRGKSAEAREAGQISQLVARGNIVLSLDLRGYGETADTQVEGKYLNEEFRVAMLAMHVGRPLLAQRVDDLLAALEVLLVHPQVDERAVHLVAVGRAGPVGLHATAIEPRFASLAVHGSIRSWLDDVVARPQDPNLIGHVVPGVLRHYDLPDLVALVGGRLAVENGKSTLRKPDEK